MKDWKEVNLTPLSCSFWQLPRSLTWVEQHRNRISGLHKFSADYTERECGMTKSLEGLVGENHVRLAVWSAHLMPELNLLGYGTWSVLDFLEVREAIMGERREATCWPLSPLVRFPPSVKPVPHYSILGLLLLRVSSLLHTLGLLEQQQ